VIFLFILASCSWICVCIHSSFYCVFWWIFELCFFYDVSYNCWFDGCCSQAKMLWNATGTALLVETHTQIDSSGKSYYGESSLYYLSADGTLDINVPLSTHQWIQPTDPIHPHLLSLTLSHFYSHNVR
jgi:hypothetical protein